jgi:hypothetical protein
MTYAKGAITVVIGLAMIGGSISAAAAGTSEATVTKGAGIECVM